MPTPTSDDVEQPVTVIFDGTNFPAPATHITNTQAGQPVKEVPTTGAADDH